MLTNNCTCVAVKIMRLVYTVLFRSSRNYTFYQASLINNIIIIITELLNLVYIPLYRMHKLSVLIRLFIFLVRCKLNKVSIQTLHRISLGKLGLAGDAQILRQMPDHCKPLIYIL